MIAFYQNHFPDFTDEPQPKTYGLPHSKVILTCETNYDEDIDSMPTVQWFETANSDTPIINITNVLEVSISSNFYSILYIVFTVHFKITSCTIYITKIRYMAVVS